MLGDIVCQGIKARMSLIKAWLLLGTICGSEISLWGHFLPPLSLSQNGISQVYDSLPFQQREERVE